jgi:SAM-dependent methyltransferase
MKSVEPIEVANFDGSTPGVHKLPSEADHVFDFEKLFPLADGSFTTVLCVNVLEHIYNYRNLLSEAHRVLSPGGHIHITVPFFFNIHGSPDDYFRYTHSALRRILTDAGFESVVVSEIGFGPCSAIFQNFGGSIPTNPLRLACMHMAIGIDSFFSSVSRRYARIRLRVPLGYYVQAKKPCSL